MENDDIPNALRTDLQEAEYVKVWYKYLHDTEGNPVQTGWNIWFDREEFTEQLNDLNKEPWLVKDLKRWQKSFNSARHMWSGYTCWEVGSHAFLWTLGSDGGVKA